MSVVGKVFVGAFSAAVLIGAVASIGPQKPVVPPTPEETCAQLEKQLKGDLWLAGAAAQSVSDLREPDVRNRPAYAKFADKAEDAAKSLLLTINDADRTLLAFEKATCRSPNVDVGQIRMTIKRGRVAADKVRNAVLDTRARLGV